MCAEAAVDISVNEPRPPWPQAPDHTAWGQPSHPRTGRKPSGQWQQQQQQQTTTDSEHFRTRPQPLFTLPEVRPATHALVASLAGIAAADGTQAAAQ
jgi:hypothetical protein